MTGPWAAGLAVYGALIVATAVAVLFIDAPYGRHDRSGWGPRMPTRVGWVLMESPTVLGVIVIVEAYGAEPSAGAWVLLAFWLVHYGYRVLIYPFLLRVRGKTMPVLIVALALAFNVFNAGLNLSWVAASGAPAGGRLATVSMAAGAVLFLGGFAAHVRSDQILRNLRGPSETGYHIPRGFLFRWVSCPNYLGEMIQWFGWALLTGAWPGLAFALYTVANLGPRALAHHDWYRRTFPDYPQERRALVPFLV